MILTSTDVLTRNISDSEIEELLNEENGMRTRELIKVARAVTDKYWGKTVRCYYPGRLFPSISITGKDCLMRCKHCNHHYLQGMIPAETPSKLVGLCIKLEKEGALGCLISGGFTPDASLPLKDYIPALQEIRNKTKLSINIHAGFMTEEIARKLVQLGIEAVSVDIVGSNETIQKVYGLNRTTEDYARMLEAAKAVGLKSIDPHVCIGVNYGELKGEAEALKMIRNYEPARLTFIALNPTRGTEMQDVNPPSPLVIGKVIAVARLAMPKASISLGCMRPSGAIRAEIDYQAILAGANRIVVPTPAALKRLEKEYRFERHQSCCVL